MQNLFQRYWRVLIAFVAGFTVFSLTGAALAFGLAPATNAPTPTPTASTTATPPSPAGTYRLAGAGTAQTTSTFGTSTGDILVVKAFTEDSTNLTMAAPTSTGASVTWSLANSDTTANYCGVYVWTGRVTAGSASTTVTAHRGSVANYSNWDALVERWDGTTAQLAATPSTVDVRGSGAPSAQFTTAAGSSASWTVCDWNAVDDSTVAFTGSPVKEGAKYVRGIYSGEYAYQAAAAGSQTLGETAPTGRKWTLVGVEIQAKAGGTTPSPTPTPSSTATTPPATTPPAPTPTPTPTSTGAVPAGVTLVAPDGGQHYNAKFSPGLPDDSSFFPISVWSEIVDSADQALFDKATGINTYTFLYGIDHAATLGYVQNAGLHSFPQLPASDWPGVNAATAGWSITDEPDMSPGWWCAPTSQQYTEKANWLSQVPKDGRSTYVNFGLGVLASQDCGLDPKPYVQGYSNYASADQYFYTSGTFEMSRAIGLGDNRLTDEQARRGSNYGIVVNRLRGMEDHKIPVWGFVEVGAPDSSNGVMITPAQVRSAMWHSIIGGARGINLFNHSFSGPCKNNSDLRTSCYAAVRSMVQSVTGQIQQIAPALNGPEASGLVTVSEPSGCFPSGSPCVDATAKWNNGSPIIMAGNHDHTSRTETFTLAGSWSSVTVVGENRTIPVVNGRFADSFPDETTVHVYQVNP